MSEEHCVNEGECETQQFKIHKKEEMSKRSSKEKNLSVPRGTLHPSAEHGKRRPRTERRDKESERKRSRKGEENDSDSTTDDEEGGKTAWGGTKEGPSGTVTMGNGSQSEVSPMPDASTHASLESRIEAMVNERIQAMEESWKRRAADEASVISDPRLDDSVKENLRRFVADRVFPKFKFIFDKETLGQVVEMALTNKHITQPDGWGLTSMKKTCSRSVRSYLDGCRANAQAVARKKYLGNYCIVKGVVVFYFENKLTGVAVCIFFNHRRPE